VRVVVLQADNSGVIGVPADRASMLHDLVSEGTLPREGARKTKLVFRRSVLKEYVASRGAVVMWSLALAILAPGPRTLKDAIITRAHLGGSSSRRAVFAPREDALAWVSEQRPVRSGA
jgi:hypothetical protein